MTLNTNNLSIVKINKAGVNSSVKFTIDIPIRELDGSYNSLNRIKFIHGNIAYIVCKNVNKKIKNNELEGMLHIGFRQVKVMKDKNIYRIRGCVNILDKFTNLIKSETDMIDPITYAIIAQITYKKYLQQELEKRI